jgi:hypothetical protein
MEPTLMLASVRLDGSGAAARADPLLSEITLAEGG